MHTRQLKVTKSKLTLIFCFITFYIPSSYAVPSIVYTIWRSLYIIVSIGAIGLLFVRARRNLPSKGYIAAISYYIWIFIITLLCSTTAEIKSYYFIKCIGFISLLEYSFSTQKKKTVIEAFLIATLLVSFLHFISYLRYSGLRGGMRHGVAYYTAGILRVNSAQNWYFLTYDNNSIYYFLAPIAVLLYYSIYINRKYLKIWITYTGFILYMYVAKMSATALVAMLVIIFGFMVVYIKRDKVGKIWNLLSYRNSILLGFLIDAIPLIMVGGEFAFKITSYFGKNAGFSGRMSIWSRSVISILEHFLTGNGFENSAVVWQKIGQTHCHNFILENFYVGGMLGFILFIITIYLYRPRTKNTLTTIIFSITILAYFVAGSMDWLAYNPLPMAIFVFNYFLSKSELETNRI